MKQVFRAHVQALGLAFGRLGKHPLESLLNILTIAITLALPTTTYLLLENFREAAARVGGELQVSVFVRHSISPEDRAKLERELKLNPKVSSYKLIPADDALKELRASTASNDLLAGLPDNPLPDTYLVQVKRRDKTQIAALQSLWQNEPGVTSVEADTEWLERLDILINAGEIIALAVGSLLALATLAGIINTIRLQVLTRGEEIEVARLFGASRAFVRRPYLYFGVAQAVIGAILACATVDWLLYLLGGHLQQALGMLPFANRLHGLIWSDGLSLVAFGGILGWGGALFSVSQQLHQLEPDAR